MQVRGHPCPHRSRRTKHTPMFCNVNTNRRGWVKRDVIRLGLVSRLIRKGTPRVGQGCPRTKCHNAIGSQR